MNGFKKEQIDLYRERTDSWSTDDSAPTIRPVTEPSPSNTDRSLVGNSDKFKSGQFRYSFLERVTDFLYYNDFYILSIILLAFIITAIVRY